MDIPGVEALDDNSAKWQRRSVLIITILPFLGFLLAFVALWGRGLSVVDASIAIGFYGFTGLGVTIGYHRLFTHQSFEATRPLKIGLAIAADLSRSVGGGKPWILMEQATNALNWRPANAPKAPGHVMRDLFTQGPGVPALVAVYQDVTAAKGAGFDNIPAPPTYGFSIQNWGRWEELQPPDGQPERSPMAEVMGGKGKAIPGGTIGEPFGIIDVAHRSAPAVSTSVISGST